MKKRELKITRTLNAPIERVWDAWTNPENLKQWKSPEGMTTPEVDVDLVVGGTYRVVMEGHNMADANHNGRMAIGGTYLEIDPPHKLVYTWLWEDSPAKTHTTTVTIKLRELAAKKTELTLIHAGFVDDNMEKEHSMGWVSTLQKLDQFLQK